MTNKNPSVIVTRPEPECMDTVSVLEQAGFAAVPLPLLTLKIYSGAYSGSFGKGNLRNKGLIFTSFRAVQALQSWQGNVFAHLTDENKIFCVGQKTAEYLNTVRRDVPILKIGRNSENLAGWITENKAHINNDLIYFSGRDTAYPLTDVLRQHGFTVENRMVYEMIPRMRLPEHAELCFQSSSPDYVLFSSAHAASVFFDIVPQKYLKGAVQNTRFLCMSRRIKNIVDKFDCKKTDVSDEPNYFSLLELLNTINRST